MTTATELLLYYKAQGQGEVNVLVDYCSTMTCFNYGFHNRTETGYDCECRVGYTGVSCEIGN